MHFCSWCDKLHCPLGKIKTDNSIVFFPFSFHGIFLSGWLVCACWKGVLVSFSASQACGICSQGFILYTTVHWLWELISSVLHSPTHISFLFFFPLSDHPWFFLRKSTESFLQSKWYLNTLIGFFSVIFWVMSAYIAFIWNCGCCFKSLPQVGAICVGIFKDVTRKEICWQSDPFIEQQARV